MAGPPTVCLSACFCRWQPLSRLSSSLTTATPSTARSVRTLYHLLFFFRQSDGSNSRNVILAESLASLGSYHVAQNGPRTSKLMGGRGVKGKHLTPLLPKCEREVQLRGNATDRCDARYSSMLFIAVLNCGNLALRRTRQPDLLHHR